MPDEMPMLSAEPATIAFAAFLVFAALATAYDLRERRIPDVLNFFFLACAAALAFFHFNGAPAACALFAAFVAAAFAFAYLVYRLGAWAGGDVKFFTAAAAFLPLMGIQPNDAAGFFSFLWLFLASAFLLVPVLVIAYWKRISKSRKEVFAGATGAVMPALSAALAATGTVFILSRTLSLLQNHWLAAIPVLAVLYFVRVPFWAGAALAVAAAWLDPVQAAVFFAPSFAVFFLAKFSQQAYAVVSKNVLERRVSVSGLREGMIPAATVLARGGKPVLWKPSFKELLANALSGKPPAMKPVAPPGRVVADASKAAGLSAAAIRELKRLGVKYLPVKESVPFAPVLAVGEIVLVVAWLAAS
ncbi:MAG: prepilin peptidase [Candidatus Micrarchaeota archaeon]|nr:prepilin peptidase [Candidatus Micrarchaeota archaeon]